MNRRHFLGGLLGVSVYGLTWKAHAMDWLKKKDEIDRNDFPFKLSDAEWRERLTKEQYYIMRGAGTEESCSSPLDKEKRAGTYFCAGCGIALFSSDNKFDSKTGWPSFDQPVSENAIGTITDYKIGYPRTEVHCNNCGSHLGHVFEDGPLPTGLRYCMNGVALVFIPNET